MFSKNYIYPGGNHYIIKSEYIYDCIKINKIKSVAYSSQESHTGQLVSCNWLADGRCD